ncbi:MAG: membrane protein insertase YidC [Treponema sp.]
MSHFLYTLVIYPLYTLIECIFSFFGKFSENQGVSVVGVSIGVTLLCLPLYAVAEKLQEAERKKQKSMQPTLDRIKAAFSGDERYMMTSAYYKECRYNPVMALRSMFGLFIQIPFFIAAYAFLSHLPSLKGASFLFIRDMGLSDALFTIGSFPVNVLPVAMTVINLVAGAIYTKGFPLKDKAPVYVSALIFLVILYPSPAGLVLYWTMNNVFSMVKNIFYKIKNPLKVFWLCACIAAAIAAAYVFFSFEGKAAAKASLALGLAFLLLLPLIVKAAQALLDGMLRSVVENAKARHTLYLVSCAVLFLLSGAALPSSLIASSPAAFAGIGSHANPLYFIGNTGLQAAGLFLFWAPCVYFLFGKRVQTVFTLAMSCAAYIALIDSYIFMLRYGDVSASLTFLYAADFKTRSLLSLVNLLAIAALIAVMPFLMKLKNAKVLTSVSSIFVLALGSVSIANMFSISKSYAAYKKAETGGGGGGGK